MALQHLILKASSFSDEEKSNKEVDDEATSNFSQPLSSDDKEYVPRAEVGSGSCAGETQSTYDVGRSILHQVQLSQPKTSTTPLFSSTTASESTHKMKNADTIQMPVVVTAMAPLFAIVNTSQPTQTRENPGIVAGLDPDWSGAL
ncbi:hypothetical protein ACOSQ3_018401 [Xanthoceras sorbifolium]